MYRIANDNSSMRMTHQIIIQNKTKKKKSLFFLSFFNSISNVKIQLFFIHTEISNMLVVTNIRKITPQIYAINNQNNNIATIIVSFFFFIATNVTYHNDITKQQKGNMVGGMQITLYICICIDIM